jgi:hypothetical protein
MRDLQVANDACHGKINRRISVFLSDPMRALQRFRASGSTRPSQRNVPRKCPPIARDGRALAPSQRLDLLG